MFPWIYNIYFVDKGAEEREDEEDRNLHPG